ncbi:flavin reductase family protein [Nonomuraea sp. NPDC004354]|uniref:flavin reductase family protein n=1 Tax=Nonomuraea sp. NPDC003804 TaxID=3154547 RepID=UPI0033BF94CC
MSTHAARLIAPDGCDGRPHVAPYQPGTANGTREHPADHGADHGADHPAGNAAKHFRSVLSRFATGVVAITALDPDSGAPSGLAANSFTSVSLDPPLVAFCVAHTSTSWPRLRAAETLTVNVLAEHQQQVCAQLAARGGDKFAGLAWSRSPGGNPLLEGALAWLECSIEAEHPAGDHVIVVARVHQLDAHADGGPLLFFRGGYGRFAS